MRSLRITVIFAILALSLAFVVGLVYTVLKPAASVLDTGVAVNDPIPMLIPIACGLLVAPITLRVNRWIERRLRS